MGLFREIRASFRQEPAPRPGQVRRIVRALEAEDQAATGDVVHGNRSLGQAGAVRAAAERAATPAEQRAAQEAYRRRHPS